MDISARVDRYSAIEAYRARPLIVYATSTRPGISARMAGDAVREFIDQIDAIPHSDAVDILIHSTGGDALTAWKLMSVLRERFKTIGVLVPYMAFSAATLFALGADEIFMHPHASLGPIDPQITIPQPDGSKRQFAYEDVGAFLRFVATDVKVSEQVHVSSIVDKLFSAVDPVNVGGAKRASELASSVGERLLQMHMINTEDKARAREIAENLNKSFFAHGDAVSRTRARQLQLKIAADDSKLAELIWAAYVGLEDYMQLRAVFNPIHVFMANPEAAASLQRPAQVSLPPNAPPQVAQAVWNAVAQNAIGQSSAGKATEVPFVLINAVVESVRTASEHRATGTIAGMRLPGGEIQVQVTEMSAGWVRVSTPGIKGGSDPAAPLLS